MPNPNSIGANQESLYGLQQMLPEELRPTGLEKIGYMGHKLEDWYPQNLDAREDWIPQYEDPYPDRSGDIKGAASRGIGTSPEMINTLMKLFSGSMFAPDPQEEEKRRRAEEEQAFLMALEAQKGDARNVNRLANISAGIGDFAEYNAR